MLLNCKSQEGEDHRTARDDAVKMGEALVDVSSTLCSPKGMSDKNLRLARDLTHGAVTAYVGDDKAEQSLAEVTKTVKPIRQRISGEAPDGASVQASAKLNTAA